MEIICRKNAIQVISRHLSDNVKHNKDIMILNANSMIICNLIMKLRKFLLIKYCIKNVNKIFSLFLSNKSHFQLFYHI